MTEIPEHLLKRAQARRAAMGQGEAPEGDAPAAAAPAGGDAAAPAAASVPAKREPAPLPTLDDDAAKVVPDSPVVAAAKRRKRVPYWAAPVLALLPLWGLIYMYSVRTPDAGASDPLAIGAEVFSANCAGCHMADGAGGAAGQKLKDGEVLKTFKDPLAMAHWVAFGADGGARADKTYGDLDREGGARTLEDHPGKMQAFGTTLTPEEIAAVVIYVRQEIAGGDPAEDPKFNATTFEADPAAAAAAVQAVIDLGAGGDPDLSGIAMSEAAS